MKPHKSTAVYLFSFSHSFPVVYVYRQLVGAVLGVHRQRIPEAMDPQGYGDLTGSDDNERRKVALLRSLVERQHPAAKVQLTPLTLSLLFSPFFVFVFVVDLIPF